MHGFCSRLGNPGGAMPLPSSASFGIFSLFYCPTVLGGSLVRWLDLFSSIPDFEWPLGSRKKRYLKSMDVGAQ